MNNSSHVGYGHWNDERFCAAVKEDPSLYVKHHVQSMKKDNKSMCHSPQLYGTAVPGDTTDYEQPPDYEHLFV